MADQTVNRTRYPQTERKTPLEERSKILLGVIAIIGIVSLDILFSWPFVRKNIKPMAAVPPQLIVLVVAVIFTTVPGRTVL